MKTFSASAIVKLLHKSPTNNFMFGLTLQTEKKRIKGQKIDNVELYLMRAKKSCKNIFISDFFSFSL